MLPERWRRQPLVWWSGLLIAVGAALVVARAVDPGALRGALAGALRSPGDLALVLVVYAAAFLLRAWVWRRVVPDLPFGQALAALHVSLGANHVLPARLGEPLRVVSVVRRTRVSFAAATASTVTLRAADLAAVGLLVVVLGLDVARSIAGAAAVWLFLLLAGVAMALGMAWLRRLAGDRAVRVPDLWVALGTLASWVLEAVVVWRAAAWVGVDLSVADAVLVTSVTIAAQVVAVAPGGFGTYEAAATAALAVLGVDVGTGLAIALTAHALKTGYALVTGALACFVPSPGLAGRLRLAARGAAPVASPPAGPVVLVLPAHDEEDSVASVIGRVPASVCGRDVRVLVVDDGSDDATAARAEAAGAEVLRLATNRGLGAAVRAGLRAAVGRGAAAVAFCDADGEYAPEELGRLIAPILAGRADYVVGSRFAGRIDRMLPHRRAGNLALTWLLRFVARAPISDGQSGYRALSRGAAARAEIVHDYNYAQVLTLDLLGKGFRYAEVPISYRFRERGRSFVRPGRYLREVIPAVHRELNTT